MGGRFLSLQSLDTNPGAALTLCQVEITEEKHLHSGYRASAAYVIRPFGCCSDRAVTAYCDMETDGGGWTLVQRRRDVLPREDFHRTWEEYAEGFGDASNGEYWLGLDAIHALTAQAATELRVDLADFEGESRFAKYSSFSVGDRDDLYRLTVAGYSGTAGDGMAFHNGMSFTTKDKDFDGHDAQNCAEVHDLCKEVDQETEFVPQRSSCQGRPLASSLSGLEDRTTRSRITKVLRASK
ncbi:fibrinogen C domain-containing protein 1-like [Penaeus chinensis]|uniref:fibrinogen C domain-containing protein 1-like n=1 Tax=Penaeus chinensis TaxID=139456 RepID=UPI001FB6F9D7|nr:fibrinogen C domain-containing protein 1-like [Penaeus chinensis]